MKIGIRAKIIISIISALMLGFIAFQIVTHSPDAGSPGSSNHQQVKQTSSHQSAKSDTSQRDISKGQKSGTIENEIGIQDEKVGEALAWLDSLEDSSMSQSTTGNKQEKDAIGEREEIYNGMTREEVVAKLAEVDKEIYDNLYTWGYLYSEVMEITQGRKSCPPNTTVEEMWSEADRAFRYAARIRALKRHQYARALGLDPSEPFRPGGWAYELIKHTSRRLGHP